MKNHKTISDEMHKSKTRYRATERIKRKEEGKERVTESRKATAFRRASGVEAQSSAVCIAWATLLALTPLLPTLSSILNFNCYSSFLFFHSFCSILQTSEKEKERKRFALSFNPKSRLGFWVHFDAHSHAASSVFMCWWFMAVRERDSPRLVLFFFFAKFSDFIFG